MNITPILKNNINIINSYGPQGFYINNKLFTKNIILSLGDIFTWNSSSGIFNLDIYNLIINKINAQATLKKPSNITLLIGTGQSFLVPPPSLLQYLQQFNLAPQIMNTFAACRTFNILASEERIVYAVLS